MAANATAKVEHLTAGELLLQPQGIGDVIGASQVPGRQLQQVTRTDGVLIELTRLFRVKGAGMQRRQIICALRQAPLELLNADLQIRSQLLAQIKAIGQKPRDIQFGGHRQRC